MELLEKYPDGTARERVYNKIADAEAKRFASPEIHLITGDLTRVVREAEDALINAGVPYGWNKPRAPPRVVTSRNWIVGSPT